MFHRLESINEPYEIVQTVGFKFSAPSGMNRHQVLEFRLEVLRFPGQQLLVPRLWETHPVGGWLHQSALILPPELCRLTVEETIAASLRFVNSKIALQGVHKAEEDLTDAINRFSENIDRYSRRLLVLAWVISGFTLVMATPVVMEAIRLVARLMR